MTKNLFVKKREDLGIPKIPRSLFFSVLLTLIILLFLCIGLLQSCGIATTRPKLEMSLAASAFSAAKGAKADRLVPALFKKAEYYYLKAKHSYKQKSFNKAKQYAILSRKYSENAEFSAVRKVTLESLQ